MLLYEDFGTGRHRESSLVRHALGSTHDEALVAGLAGGVGFMYFVFDYAGRPPRLTIVAQAHPDPWIRSALDRLRVPYDVTHSAGPRWDRNFGFSGMEKLAAHLRDTRTRTGWERRFAAPEAFLAGTRRLYACLEQEWTAPGATRPLYADFLDLVGRPGAAALFRESAGHWSRLAELARTAGPDQGATARRALFDEFAALVEQALALERRAVALL